MPNKTASTKKAVARAIKLDFVRMEALKKNSPVSVPDGLSGLQKSAVLVEEKMYTAATSRFDYLRKISLRMLSLESQTETQQNPGNSQVIPNQSPPGPVNLFSKKKERRKEVPS